MAIDLNVFTAVGFEWDAANLYKNKSKHNVDPEECLQVFFNTPLVLFADEKHSGKEERHGVLGRTDKDRRLAIFFTIRHNRIRVISARSQGKRDKLMYGTEERRQKLSDK